MPPLAVHGLLVLDKPCGITSRDLVNRAQRWFPRRTRVGHTGTLDPLATGVLVLCIGNATRLAEYVQDLPKTYRAGIVLGATSDSDDADSHVTPTGVEPPGDDDSIRKALPAFLGVLEQVPPAYSAAHVDGQRAYDLARRGKEVVLAPRRVEVYDLRLLDYQKPRLDLEVRCGKGTYVRALARDLGARLGCGGHIASLRRTHVGPFAADGALGLDGDPGSARARLLPVAAALAGLPRVDLTADAARRFRSGVAVPGSAPARDEVAVFGPAGELLGVAAVDRAADVLRPVKVLGE